MILITGASGKTGRAILKLMASSAEGVRALVHHPNQVDLMKSASAQEVIVGDLESQAALDQACQGIRAIYLICPNMHPHEDQIARMVIDAALRSKVERLVYHSVLHPQVEAMPHHWNKLRVEEMIFTAGLPFTILQPCAYMQNVLGYWSKITTEGVYAVPYSIQARLSMVDLEDVARVALKALVEPDHQNAIYELSGPEALSQVEVAAVLARVLGKPVTAQKEDPEAWEQQARASGMNDFARETLLKMFRYYDQFGLTGSSSVLAWLLRRPPTNFLEFVLRTVQERNVTPFK